MGTYAEYIQKSNELFGIIGGRYSVKTETIALFKAEYERLVNEVAFAGEYPIGATKEVSSDPVSAGYVFRVEKDSFNQAAINKIYAYFNRLNVELEDTGPSYLGNLAAVKSKCRFVIITNSSKNIRAIGLINELFYHTPDILVMSINANGEIIYANDSSPVKVTPIKSQSKPNENVTSSAFDLPTTGWDTLD